MSPGSTLRSKPYKYKIPKSLMVKKRKTNTNALDFKTAFKYPFNRAKGMFNILWILLPIIGWFALGGYVVRIIKEFSQGKFKNLPTMKFGDDLKLGFFMFLKAIPFWLAVTIPLGILAAINPTIEAIIETLLALIIFPILVINFMNKQTVASFFEFRTLKPVLDNFGDYFKALLKEISLAIIFVLMWVVLVGFPAGVFTKNIFLADFYRRKVKNK